MSWAEAKAIMGSERVLLGPQASYQWLHDPKHLLFVLARYKHAARLIGSASTVLEVGCGEGIGARILAEGRRAYLGIDPDEAAVAVAREAHDPAWFRACSLGDVEDFESGYDAVVALDVIEHLPADDRALFVRDLDRQCAYGGICIVGTPNATARAYQSEASRAGHHALLDAVELRALLAEQFPVVQVFGMNDEVLHTGFLPMAHYLLAVGIGPR
jgi:2-polyprenyl-3-methyl-5-hydroxy-6-metoxy-1,4-benzoquinol methylase